MKSHPQLRTGKAESRPRSSDYRFLLSPQTRETQAKEEARVRQAVEDLRSKGLMPRGKE